MPLGIEATLENTKMLNFAQICRIIALFSLLTAPALAQQGAYFVLGTGMPLTIERVDPVMSPGSSVSQHVHSVVGGNGWASTMNFAQTQTSTCSTAEPVADKSNYVSLTLNSADIVAPPCPHRVEYDPTFGRRG